jgi:mannose/cellobiose epimerase-like protein (N-acyl-D-glucosamine 2-epimerase family)
MAFARLFDSTRDRRFYDRAVHFLDVLLSTACRCPSGYGWGYPFDWETIDGTFPRQTALVTTLPYVYEAFAAVHRIDGQARWFDVMRSIAEHALRDYRDHDTGSGAATCSYTMRPSDPGYVVNASAYRAFLLTKAAYDFREADYLKTATRNLRFVIEAQNADGSWYYAADGRRGFVDHYHTCFVLKGLARIEQITGDAACRSALSSGMEYYVRHLFDERGLPRPFAKAPRIIVYRRELYDYAECINLGTLVAGRFPQLDGLVATVLEDLLARWRKADGSFRTRQLLVGWDEVPLHRWAQAQMFRSLTGLLPERQTASGEPALKS